MTDPTAAFSNMVPGFDFLQNLMKNAGAAMPPGVGQWIAPTLDPADLEKRIEELRTVQFWLEQNVRMIAASIQALEVQRMTLTTLKSMNVSMSDLTESLKIRMPEPAPAPPPAVAPEPPAPVPEPEPAAAAEPASAAALPKAPAGVIDPVQWWGALTQQFAKLAAGAIGDGKGEAPGQAADTAAKAPRRAAAKTAAAKKSRAAGAKTAPPRRAAAKPR